MSSLTSFGVSSEVAEVAQEFMDEEVASRFIRKAVAAGASFQPDEIMDISVFMDKPTLSKPIETSAVSLNRAQLEAFYMLIDDATFEKASKQAKVDIFADADEHEEVEMDDFEVEEEQPPQIGFFTALALGLGLQEKVSHINTAENAAAIVPTVLLTTATATDDDIMVITTPTAVRLAGMVDFEVFYVQRGLKWKPL